MPKILILGGGTAGWMAANALVSALGKKNFSVCLVESPAIGTIGVGEGSTPHLKLFFEQLGISEETWMPACNATYKNGISFVDWTAHLKQNRYFHPFPSGVDRQTAVAFLQNCMRRHKGKNVEVNPDHFFLARELSAQGLSPKVAENRPKFPMNYAYHFDSNLLGEFLCNEGIKRGVEHIQGTFVRAIDKSEISAGGIEAIELSDGQRIHADFFIDASGFKSHLLQSHLNVAFKSFANNLFNDSAIALPSIKSSPLLAETKASALSAGWAWHIPLLSRTGNGYVFSSKYIDFEQAEEELRAHLDTTGQTVDSSASVRQIKMKVGRVEQSWKANVMAIGLSQGFIEPLEATALHLVMDSINLFLQNFADGKYTQENIERVNHGVQNRYEGIRDYIVCHYKVNSKSKPSTSSSVVTKDYWQDCANLNDISDNLSAVLDAWENKQDIIPVLEARNMTQYYPAISWYCLLAGYGYFPHTKDMQDANSFDKQDFARMRRFIEMAATNFTSHEEQLAQDSSKTT